ncbi:MAG: penicillin-binding protein 1C [Gammaproteobacteria bacterium]|jgi:penicillin-binding protein 1C
MKHGLVALLLLSVIAALGFTFLSMPKIDSSVGYSRAYFDRDGQLLRLTLADDDRYRLFQPLANISPQFIQATLLYEDQHYYSHFGVDVVALFRAFWTSYITREHRIGASTITMQLARLIWKIESTTVGGKLEQIFRALQLTRYYSKQEVLERYLNLAPYGRNIEGIGAASRIYFNKLPGELNLIEALTLAVIPQNPVRRNPTTKTGFNTLSKARKLLFDKWVIHHPQDNDKSFALDLPMLISSPEALPFKAPHFVNYLNQQTQHQGHGTIRTSLDLHKQQLIEQQIHQTIAAKSAQGIHNASALLLNYQTMSIEAMVGSASFFDTKISGQVNGTLAKRSPGSTLKPFVYGLAIDEGLIHPASLLKDAPRRFGGFTPENFDKRFMGPISAKQALIQSRNVPAVDLQSRLKTYSFHRFLINAGVSDLREASFYGLALALGGGELTMLELLRLYAALANRGELKPIRNTPNSSAQQPSQILSPEASFLILDILKDNPPPGKPHSSYHPPAQRDLPWKTGTSWSFRDAWAIGISGPYVLAVWIGNFDGKGNHAFTGRQAAGPLLFSIFDELLPNNQWRLTDQSDLNSLNLKRLLVCETTGDLFEKNCPTSRESWFIPGISPIRVSNVYRKIPIEPETGHRACWHLPGTTVLKLYEFWPSDYLEVFERAGIVLRRPPPFSPDCDLEQSRGTGSIPRITSPQNNIEYAIHSINGSNNQIPFGAITDPDVERLYWFVNEQFVGESIPPQKFFWEAAPGRFEVRVVDDSGRAASKHIVVNQVR